MSTQKIILILLVSGGLFGVFLYSNIATSYVITYTSEGFEPDELVIQKGDVVTYVNSSDLEFWPASDIHPTHEIYPEFDPQQSLPPGEEWSFTFNESGTWYFHDHITPLYSGKIIVK